ncbi:MAG: hypothetical protein GXX91_01435 [Verrucomicrobiaceae bacterium]|nr:hypothetical protein [Verrucomicrobiaceae bacterium]
MSATDIAKLCEALPSEKREQVADFVRFLLEQQDDARWEEILDEPRPRPALNAFLRESTAEGSEPFDRRRL